MAERCKEESDGGWTTVVVQPSSFYIMIMSENGFHVTNTYAMRSARVAFLCGTSYLFAKSHYQIDRCSHIGMIVAMIGKSASSLKCETKGTASGNSPTIECLPVITGYCMGC